MEIAVILHCLKNNDKKKVCTCSVQTHVFPIIFHPWMVESEDMEPQIQRAGYILNSHTIVEIKRLLEISLSNVTFHKLE
jgi:hypothetical protein